MAVFPMFFDIMDKKCVIIGGGNVATRKIETLLEFGALVTVVSLEITEKIKKWKWEGKLAVSIKGYTPDDIDGAFLVVAATSDRNVNERVYNDSVERNIPVNIADNPHKCTFIFPSVVKRGELVIGISSSGGYPALSKKLRSRIEEVIPDKYENVLEILKKWRKHAESAIAEPEKRREALNRIMQEVLDSMDTLSQEQLEKGLEKIFKEYEDEKAD